MREGNLCGCTGESPEAAPWAKRSFPPRIVTKGIGTTVQSIGTWARSMGYLWACGISSRCPWPRGFSWANRALCTFPTTAMRAQAFSILFTYLGKERATAVSRQLLLQPTAFWFSTQPLIFPQWFIKTIAVAVHREEAYYTLQLNALDTWAHRLRWRKGLLLCSKAARWHQSVVASSEAHQRSTGETTDTLFMTEN